MKKWICILFVVSQFGHVALANGFFDDSRAKAGAVLLAAGGALGLIIFGVTGFAPRCPENETAWCCRWQSPEQCEKTSHDVGSCAFTIF